MRPKNADLAGPVTASMQSLPSNFCQYAHFAMHSLHSLQVQGQIFIAHRLTARARSADGLAKGPPLAGLRLGSGEV